MDAPPNLPPKPNPHTKLAPSNSTGTIPPSTGTIPPIPPSYRQLVGLIIDRIAEPVDVWPSPAPVFVPVFGHYAKAWMRLKRYFVDGVVVLCDDREFVSEFKATSPHTTVRPFSSVTEEEPIVRPVLVVATPEVDDHQLVLAFAMARKSLVVAFIHDNPHRVLRKIRVTVMTLLEEDAQFVNWERRPRKRKYGGALGQADQAPYDWYKGARDVPTVKDLVHHLVRVVPGGKHHSLLERFQIAAHKLGWVHAPKLCGRIQGMVNLVPPGLSDAWRRIAGNAVEHLVDHAACQVGHPGSPHRIVLPPDCVLEYLGGVQCADPAPRELLNKDYRARRSTMTREEWTVYFERGGVEAMDAEVLDRLHNKPPPHLLVPPESATPEIRALVMRAADTRADTHDPLPDERAWWVLGALDYLGNHNDAGPLLELAADPHFSPSVKIPGLFKRARGQLRSVLHRLDVQSILPQVVSNARGKYRGKADFVINKSTILELKFSSNDAQYFEWALQAAIYAHTHRYKRFCVLNLGTGSFWDYWLCRMDDV